MIELRVFKQYESMIHKIATNLDVVYDVTQDKENKNITVFLFDDIKDYTAVVNTAKQHLPKQQKQ